MKAMSLILASFLLCASYGCSNTSRNQKTAYDNPDQDSDGQITTRVKSALMNDTSLSRSGRLVGVETTDGVVTLTGDVPTTDESRSIERKVKSIKGVRRIDNQLIINP